jgi:hypothetical protein
MYSQTRLSTFDAYQTSRLSVDKIERRPGAPTIAIDQPTAQDSRLSIAPGFDVSRLSVAPNGQEQRLSEFYDAYYRHSSIEPSQGLDAKGAVGRHSTIVEAETPLASPKMGKKMSHLKPAPGQPGAAY